LLDEYGGQLKAALPEFMWDYQKYDGEIYGVPTYQMCGDFRGIFFFKEQAEKYLDIEGFKKALYKSPTFTQEVYDMLTKYIEDMKADGLNFKSATVLNEKGYEPIISGLGYIVKGDESCQIINKDMSDAARIRFKTAREWYEKGYIREDVLSATDDNNYMGKIDGFPFWDGVWTPFVAEQYSQKYGHELIVIPYEDEYYIPSKNSAAGTSIMSTSKYKKEAMQVLNLIQTDKELYNMLVFGLEGEHYKKTGDDSVEVLDDNGTASNSKYALAKWLLGNTELAYNNQFEPDAYKTWVFEEANRSEWKSPLLGFMPDTTDIQDYMTQLNVVTETYKKPLTVGVMSNWEEYLREYEAELNKVGNKEMLANVQNQIDEFLANKA